MEIELSKLILNLLLHSADTQITSGIKLPTVLKCAELLQQNFDLGNCIKLFKKQLKERNYYHRNENKTLTDNYNKQN
jgi:hypothetical protein